MLALPAKDSVALWDLQRRAKVGAVPVEFRPIKHLAFGPRGRYLVVARYDGPAWVCTTARPACTALPTSDTITAIAFDSEEREALLGNRLGTIVRWDLERGATIGSPFTGAPKPVMALGYEPDAAERRALAIDQEGAVTEWTMGADAPRAEKAGVVAGHVTDVVFLNAARAFVATASGTQHSTAWAGGIPGVFTSRPLGEGALKRIAPSPAGSAFAWIGNDGRLRVTSAASDKDSDEALGDPSISWTSVAFDRTGTRLVSAASTGEVALWDLGERESYRMKLAGPGLNVFSPVALSPDQRMIAWPCRYGEVCLQATADGARLPSLPWKSPSLTVLAFSRDGARLMTGALDGTITAWDLASRRSVRSSRPAGKDPIVDLVWLSDGDLMARSYEGTLARLDPETLAVRRALRADGIPMFSMAASPTRPMLAVSKGGQPYLLDAQTLAPIREQPNVSRNVYGLAFHPDGKVLAAAGEPGVILWDIDARREAPRPVTGLQTPLMPVFSRDGTRLAVLGQSGALVVWDLDARRAITPLLPAQATQGLPRLTFGADGQTLWTANEFSPPVKWDLDPQSWVRRACRVANRTLTQVEWERYVASDLPLRNACAVK
jgi:WD40 repeat protein